MSRLGLCAPRLGRSIAIAAACAAAAPAVSFGNVYATNLGQSAGTVDVSTNGSVDLRYLLNENADNGVSVQVLDASNTVVRTLVGGQAKGTNSVTWDGRDSANNPVAAGNYTFRVNAADNGYASWTKISTDSQNTSFYSPRGIDVNRNASSPYFGRVYVGENGGATTANGANNRTTADGVYILNADTSVPTGLAGAQTGGRTWPTPTTSSPFRVAVGPDDRVYVTDWTDTTSGIYVGNANYAGATAVFNGGARAASGLTSNHGSIPTVYVEGIGADRRVYTMDEDYTGGVAGANGSINRYDVGTVDGYSAAPTVVYNDAAAGNKIGNFTNDLARSNDGTWWISQNRGGLNPDTYPDSLIQISADGSSVLWDSNTGTNSITDPLRTIWGIAFDPVNDWLAIGHLTGTGSKITILDDETKAVLASIPTGASSDRDLAFDAVGNLYVINNGLERMTIYSPPNSANQFGTNSLEAIVVAVPEPTSLAALGLGGLALLRRRRA